MHLEVYCQNVSPTDGIAVPRLKCLSSSLGPPGHPWANLRAIQCVGKILRNLTEHRSLRARSDHESHITLEKQSQRWDCAVWNVGTCNLLGIDGRPGANTCRSPEHHFLSDR